MAQAFLSFSRPLFSVRYLALVSLSVSGDNRVDAAASTAAAEACRAYDVLRLPSRARPSSYFYAYIVYFITTYVVMLANRYIVVYKTDNSYPKIKNVRHIFIVTLSRTPIQPLVILLQPFRRKVMCVCIKINIKIKIQNCK